LRTQFLNKVDILARKIQSGIRFAEHVTSYRNKPNEPKEVIKCALRYTCLRNIRRDADSDTVPPFRRSVGRIRHNKSNLLAAQAQNAPARHLRNCSSSSPFAPPSISRLIDLSRPFTGHESDGHRHQ
jgi:hypothetical protein